MSDASEGSAGLERWGMSLFIFTEAMLFAFLLFSYFYVDAQSAAWPPEPAPELRLALPNTALLLLSSVTMWIGERGIRRGSQLALRLGMLGTFLLGAVFLGIQGLEYTHIQYTPQSHAYGSLFFVITGFHGAHVATGLLMNLHTQGRAWLGHFTGERHAAVRITGLYWHFVDVVWIFVFSALYLSPRLL